MRACSPASGENFMRVCGFAGGWRVAVATAVIAASIVGRNGPAQAAIPATSCADLNGSTLFVNGSTPPAAFTAGGSSFVAGQRITATANIATTVTLSGAVAAAG